MSKLPLDLSPTRAFSKLDRTDFARELWRAAYAMARHMVRDHRTSTAWTWYLDHARRRFGASGWRIAQKAGSLAFDRRTVGYAASGSVELLERQGLIRATAKPHRGNLTGTVAYRCATLERVRPQAINLAWGWDELASSSNRSLRAYRAQRLREARAVARAMAEDRLALAEERFAITPAGVAALRAAEAARATA
jgi:hypothetical protein